jgi:hypothetical protein
VKWGNAKKLRILDFDIENRPLTYRGKDYTSADVTAIAASFADEKHVHCWLLGTSTAAEMLQGFLDLYERADVVTGHYIRGHDLPILNSALIEAGLPMLRSRWTCDTYLDLYRHKELSVAQGELAEMMGVPANKYEMSQTKWRSANRLDPVGLKHVKRRVVGDVRQHKLLRVELLNRGLLKDPKRWTP